MALTGGSPLVVSPPGQGLHSACRSKYSGWIRLRTFCSSASSGSSGSHLTPLACKHNNGLLSNYFLTPPQLTENKSHPLVALAYHGLRPPTGNRFYCRFESLVAALDRASVIRNRPVSEPDTRMPTSDYGNADGGCRLPDKKRQCGDPD